MSKIFDVIADARNINADFICPTYERSIDAILMPDTEKAVARIQKAEIRREKVLIYGDYDVDGVTASTAMYDILRLVGIAKVDVMLPNRFTDGYGMSKRVVEKAKADGVTLVITVDCGSRNHEIVTELKKYGIDTIITDHHECSDILPDAVAIVNPKRTDVDVPAELKMLAGVGVVFKVAQALVNHGLIPKGQEKWLLDLVLIGTICDSMPLLGENRRLCYFGFRVLSVTRRLGLKELIKQARVKEVTAETIGFQIGPRLNAAGRLDTAELALKLLMSKKVTEAAKLAQELEDLNTKRREQQIKALNEIQKNGVDDEPVIVVQGDWHEGVLGIIAGHLTDLYKKPAFVFAKSGQILKGSGRSFGDFSLAKALKACQDCILGGGGHAEACGVQLEMEKFNIFKTAMNDYYKSLNLTNQERFLDVKADVDVSNFEDLTLELVDELGVLEPFGQGNLEPVFLLKNVRVIDADRLGNKKEHLRLLVWDESGMSLKLMCFNAAEEYLGIQDGAIMNVWATLVDNEFRGTRSVEGRIVKIEFL